MQLTTNASENIKLLRMLSQQCYPDNRVLADMTFIQAILEAGLRSSPPSSLALKYNNLFGIKGKGTGLLLNGQLKTSVSLPTKEYVKGKVITVNQMFAVNASIEDSLAQHKRILELPRYKNLHSASSFDEAAHMIKADGYATDIHYPSLLIDLHKEYCK